ncbi:MAG: glycoside hydrolase family 3 C-terminal domain-containing protein [Bacteroidota bacterium]|nr:glycoside hydrolase family 3 C-terminal domain-containing protein [Bacteroidota bacterium]MDP4268566.1 glycoside hydrolase family 3 C-terminal domain-containing protein [Bacteroidota bacterium]
MRILNMNAGKMKRRNIVLPVVLAISVCSCFQMFAQPGKNSAQALEQKVEAILKQMTIEEKVAMCSGNGGFKGVERLKIPGTACTDGPRGPNCQVGTTAFPAGILFGSTWNPSIVEKAGKVIGEETRAMGRGVLLGPGCNILRDPLNGRFFEYYTEDPLLNGAIAAAQIRGIQSEGVAACIKHYACNNREDNRNFYMSMIDDRTLNEIYLPGFKAAVRDANVWTVMTSANGVNGEFVSDSKKMLTDILKNRFGFDGFVMTDWLQTRSVEKAAFAGLDVSMPGGDNCGFGTPLLEAVKAGKVPVSVVDEKVRRILRVYGRIGLLDGRDLSAGASINTKEHQQTALHTAEEGIILLQNKNNALPLNKQTVKKVLVTGPNADKRFCLLAMGGSSWVESPYEITVLKGIQNELGADRVNYISSDDLGGYQLIPENVLSSVGGKNGFHTCYYVKGKNEPVLERTESNVNFMWEMKSPDPSIPVDQFREARFDAQIMPPVDGKYTFRFITGGGSALVYNNEWAGAPMAVADPGRGTGTVTAAVDLKKGVPFHLCVIYSKGSGDAAMRIEWEMPESSLQQMQLTKIDEAAREADAVVYVGGLDHSIDTEGRDRVSLAFPLVQEKLINHLAGLNKKVNVVLINGSPLEVGGFLPNVASLTEAWYPGMEGGNAVAKMLFGDIDPSGRLSFSWTKKLEDSPCVKLASQNHDAVNFAEKLMIGYRYFDTKQVEPQFPFGYGLSYATFAYTKMNAVKAGNHAVKGSLMVKNTSKRDGYEVVQIYVKPLTPSVERPVHELKAFKKVFVKAGQTVKVDFTLDDSSFSYFDPGKNDWVVDHGRYEIQAGASSRNILATVKTVY